LELGLATTGGEETGDLEGAFDGLATGTVEDTRLTGAVVEKATGEAMQKVRPV